MYAYCNNHPVGTADYDGHVLSIVLSILYIAVAIVLSVVWVCFVAPVLMDHQNSGYATPYMERDLIETVPSTPSVGNILNKEEVKSKFKDDAEETTETGVEGESGRKTAKEIISDRVQGLDLEAHPTSNKQLSSSKMKELKNKIDSRTATREEYNLYEWNKKISQRRSEGVKDFWNQERERIISGARTTRNWSQEQIADILSGKTPKYNEKPIQGHHAYSVSQYPHLANKGEVIYPVTLNEHLNGWHG